MKCEKCQREVGVLDRICPFCGASLSVLGDPAGERMGGDLLDRVNREVENALEAGGQGLLEGGLKSPELGSGEVHGGMRLRLGALDEPGFHGFFSMPGFSAEPTAEEIQQVAQFVFHSTHVQSNPLYRERAAATTLRYLPQDTVVNAFATDQAIPELEADPPVIVLLGGMARATSVASTGLGLYRTDKSGASRDALILLIRAMGERIVRNCGTLGLQEAEDLLSGLPLEMDDEGKETLRRARSFEAAMVMAVVAHELGHVVLGHTLGKTLNLEISRNQEREADSFASSVASASPFSDYIVAGGLFWWVILTWVEAVAGSHEETTHPYSRDRLMDYLRANRSQAVAMGLTRETIQAFLPHG